MKLKFKTQAYQTAAVQSVRRRRLQLRGLRQFRGTIVLRRRRGGGKTPARTPGFSRSSKS